MNVGDLVLVLAASQDMDILNNLSRLKDYEDKLKMVGKVYKLETIYTGANTLGNHIYKLEKVKFFKAEELEVVFIEP